MKKSVVIRRIIDNCQEDARLMGIIALLECGDEQLTLNEARRRCGNGVANFLSKEYRREIRRQAMESQGDGNDETIQLTMAVRPSQEVEVDARKIARMIVDLGGDPEDLADNPISVASSLMGGKIRRALSSGN